MRKVSSVFCLFIPCFFVSCFYLKSSSLITVQILSFVENRLFHEPINSTFPIIFYHDAYVDFRYSPPRLRIFALSACLKKYQYLPVDVHYKEIESPIRMELSTDSIEGRCPSTYRFATPCYYVAHTLVGDLQMAHGIEKVTIIRDRHNTSLTVREIHKRVTSGLTVCLQPVYYYSQWQNIVLYIEAWKAQGASRFIVFYHSGTKETRRVLEYYQKQGTIELRSWPNFGNLPSEIANSYPKIDESVFKFSYFLAMNICILDIRTTLGTVADFDEVMVARNGTVLEYALKEMTGTNVGALRFENNYVNMEPSLYTSDFSGVASPMFNNTLGPPKNIFNATVIELAEVHFMRSYIEPKVSKNADGALLHFRFGSKQDTTVSKPFKFFPSDTRKHIKKMQDTANKIFNGSLPKFSPHLIEGFNQCVERLKSEGVCWGTGGLCKTHMDSLGEWVYDDSKGLFLF